MDALKSGLRLLETSQLLAYVANNEACGVHRAGYNGIASLIPKNLGNNIFVPVYCGMNYEITSFEGFEQNDDQMYEPRRKPIQIIYSDDTTVRMHQSPSDCKGIEAFITFRVEEPYYIHQNIKLVFHKKLKERMNFSSLFASYLHIPPNRNAYLKIGPGNDDLEGWVGVTKAFHRAPRYLAHELPNRELSVQEHFELLDKAPLLPKHEAIHGPLPFYYGLYYDYAFIMMFREPEKVRFAYSPNGGDVEQPWSPAWDYVLVQDDITLGTTYEWNVCLAVKPYSGRKDILDEVRRYNS